jgi:DNA (cytosine-5)-methyltransferase 1
MMTHGSLFTGIGGIDLGFERAGMKTVWQVEINEFSRRVIKKNWPLLRHQGFQCDVISGGFPCQDISIANRKGRGLKGERSGLWYEMLKTIGLLRPKYAVIENVPKIAERGLHEVLSSLAEAGYNAEWFTLPACDVGAPHRRERTFVVAYSTEVRWHDGIHNHRQDALQKNGEWDISEDIKSGLQWERWLIQNSEADNGKISKGDFFGVDDGISEDMDRIKALGDAVVPQVAEYIGRNLMRFEDLKKQLGGKG